MIGGATAANMGLDRMLERKGVPKPPKAAWNEAKRLVRGKGVRAAHPLHAPYMTGKVATASLRTVGIPLAAYGAFNLISPGDKVARVRIKDDVVKPTLRTATGVSQARQAHGRIKANRQRRRAAEQVGKSQLTDREDKSLQRRKQAGRNISLAAGTMGLGALALRAPELVRVTGKIPRVGKIAALQRVARHERGATKTSNALGTVAIGTGSIGSFNYATQQKLERKKFAKSLVAPGVWKPASALSVAERVVVRNARLHRTGEPSTVHARRRPKQPKRFVRESDKAVFRNGGYMGNGRYSGIGPKDERQMITPGKGFIVGKRDDKFLRDHADRVSPQAEKGYRYLREGRNEALKDIVRDPRHARQHGRKAHVWTQKKNRIRAKGYERAGKGEYGRDRDVAKGLVRVPRPSLRKPSIRPGHIATSALGRKYTVRGSVR